jgi:hypothetical protein
VVLRRDSNQNDGNISQYNRIRGPLVWARANKNVMFAVERGYDAEAQVMGNPDAVCLCAPDFPVDRPQNRSRLGLVTDDARSCPFRSISR